MTINSQVFKASPRDLDCCYQPKSNLLNLHQSKIRSLCTSPLSMLSQQVKDKVKEYTKRYFGSSIELFPLDSKVHNLFKVNPARVPIINPVPAATT